MTLNKSTLSEQIYQILRADILSQKIPLGEKLTLKNLKERFEVSSTPIREALTRLTEDGLVNYYSNIGVNVISMTEQDLAELFQFMGDLDRLAILYSGSYPDQETVCRELESVISKTRIIEEKGSLLPEDVPLWIEYSDRFHLLFYDYCNNSRLTHAAEKLRSQLTIFSGLYETETEPQRKINEMHTQIYELYRSGKYNQAGDLMKQHLDRSLQYALSHLKEMKKE
ncbi:MAG: GntR family transcriptional regulator [Candidatus Choladocola sp.]|nr:GntR family transcriptional regulator [Candidatus Choladocola sp.]